MKSVRSVKSIIPLFFAGPVILALLMSGCLPRASGDPSDSIPPVPSKSYADLVLFFGDDQAMEVLPEYRRVEIPSDPSQRESEAVLAVKELLSGPKDALLRKTLPSETRLLSLEVTDGVALVSFSKEIQTKHWGGSAGETMTVDSLVLTLTGIEGIEKVQILVEGKTIDTIAGHLDVSRPFSRQVRLGPFFTSDYRAEELQKRVGGGQDAWRKDFLEVANRESQSRGLSPDLTYKPVSSGQGKATVDAVGEDGGKDYQINLVQPQKQGEDGVWVISEIREK